MSDSEISTYPKTPRNTVQRYRNLAKYDHHTIHSIINSSPFLHVSFNTPSPSDPFPALLPMIGFAGKYNPQNPDEEDIGEGANIYIHGYVSSRLMRMGKSAGEGGGGGDDDDDEEEKGLPMTVAATCLDGLVLALAPYNHNYNYRSAVIQGYGQVVEDVDEKLWAMKKITNTVHPARWENSRNPPTKTEMTTTQILLIHPLTASSKLRRGGPPDPKADLQNLPLRERVWTGTIPVHLQYGTPIAAEECRVAETPGYIEDFVRERNAKGGEFAVRMAGEEGQEGQE